MTHRRTPRRLDLSKLTDKERNKIVSRIQLRTFKRFVPWLVGLVDPTGHRFSEDDAVCWEFEGYRTPPSLGASLGHGQIKIAGRLEYVHRVSEALAHGPIPRGMYVRHLCDNPPCWRPLHIARGSKADNERDKNGHAWGCRKCGRENYGLELEYCAFCGANR